MAITFDTLEYVNQLRAADVPEKQAQVQAKALRNVLDTALAEQVKVAQTVSERTATELDTKTERALLKMRSALIDMQGEIVKTQDGIAFLRKDMESMQNKLLVKLSTVMVALFGLSSVLNKFW